MSDIANSFAYLQDNIPQWLQDIARVEAKVTAMQDEITRVAISRSPFAKSKSGSVDSIRTGKMDAIAEEAAPTTGAHTDPLGNRKRKTPSVLSGRISGPSRYRARTMVVVSYDGDMQKSLELLVRAIGIGRNLLRKARMESKMNELAALASFSDEADIDHSEGEDSDPISTYRPRMSAMRAKTAARTSGRLGVTDGTNTPVALFETTDKRLEQAQELCEKAAHLTLREGDCRKELASVRKSFEEVLHTAETEVVKSNAQKLQDTPELQHDTSDTSISSLETPSKDHCPPTSLPTLVPEPQPKVPQLAGITPATLMEPKILDMEVDDDDDDEDVDFVMPPIRLTSRMNARS
ncbi:hypothetical protein T440DRAFT_158342 [Plenodomus tracheiphilus IPT5]|uniref:Uncharacterized protein n=1 Tax=Plenodomus tracheiphilus IPT5 TaxID=1408161 RepID=A0A6A7BJB4_9PLEO|nr:hypothetical protein T440DRAFT_158342 [Plenodomus tracheiphilus IPT5]